MPHIGEKAEQFGSKTSPASVTPGASPYTYTAATNGLLIVTGGTVSLIEYGRNGSFVSIGMTAGQLDIMRGDQIRVTYTVAPTMTFIAG